MIFHLPLRDAEELRELIGGKPGANEESDDALTNGL